MALFYLLLFRVINFQMEAQGDRAAIVFQDKYMDKYRMISQYLSYHDIKIDKLPILLAKVYAINRSCLRRKGKSWGQYWKRKTIYLASD